jgi:DNA ligase-1
VLLAEIVGAWRAVASTTSRLTKVEVIAALLRQAEPEDAEVIVTWLSGELRQRRTGVGWATLRDVPSAATAATLTVSEVDASFEAIAGLSGSGSAGERRRRVHEVFARATDHEQAFLRALVSGELRQGALEAVMTDAIARASGVPVTDVRRAVMLCGAPAPVAVSALRDGSAGLLSYGLRVGRPVQPMLASTAPSVADAMARLGSAAVEWKLDGIRVQVHRSGADVGVFTRSLDDITARVPEIVEQARALPAQTFVLDGEAIALRADGRPRPFQETGSRVASRAVQEPAPLSWFVFDVLHVDGRDMLDRPASDRDDVLSSFVPASLRAPRLVTSSVDEAQAFFAETVARGHEGVVVKSLDAPYEAGRRGAGWLKVKPVHTLDLVVLAAEWGHGRRRGWLSNLHLGARDPESGEFVMLGKTFKGLTDDVLRWQTEKLLSLETSRNEWQVFVAPALVVEIAIDGVQRSSRYPGGVALRFARVLRYRGDKNPAEADTIETVQALLT